MLNQKVAVVTGAASGIGNAIAKKFAQEGADVALLDYNEKITDIAKEFDDEFDGKMIGVTVDISKNDQVEDAIKTVIDQLGKIDYAVNNAGKGELAPFADLTDQNFDDTINIDLRGTFYCMRAELKYFLESGSGSIVNTGALGSLQAAPGMGAYLAAKSGILGMTKAAAMDYATNNIRVNAIAPGLTLTNMTKHDLESDPEIKRNLMGIIPMKRYAEPSEMADVAVFLASSATFMTGQVIAIDGGVTAGAN